MNTVSISILYFSFISAAAIHLAPACTTRLVLHIHAQPLHPSFASTPTLSFYGTSILSFYTYPRNRLTRPQSPHPASVSMCILSLYTLSLYILSLYTHPQTLHPASASFFASIFVHIFARISLVKTLICEPM